MGLLVIRGELRVSQFWPKGGSDADTAVVEVLLAAKKPFTFVDNQGGRHPTRVFYNAHVIGRQGPMPVVKFDKKLNADKVNVRLQGIDAPELHFQPTVKGSAGKNGKFRQNLGETCAHALYGYLSKLGLDRIPCEVLSRVQKPSDVCDVYGRVVGNLIIGDIATKIDINHWLIREGWGLPGLYNSMTKNEIRQLLVDHAYAAERKRGLFKGKYVRRSLVAFNKKQVYTKGTDSFKPYTDKGHVNFPKFFRRQADHFVRRAVGTPSTPASFLDYVKSKRDDIALDINAFLKHQGAATDAALKKRFEQLASFIKAGQYPTGKEVVFWEAESKLLNTTSGKPITKW